MHTSGLVLDVHDDFDGAVLRSVYPTFDAIPGSVKTAHRLTTEELSRLPDEAFAVVLVNGTETIRKFACVDEGNTQLALDFFLKTGHKLPTEAQKVAAQNLKEACAMFRVGVPEVLEKVAFGVEALMRAGLAVPIAQNTHQAIQGNLAASRALEGEHGGIVTPHERASLLAQAKLGEINGTTTAPLSVPTPSTGTASKTVVTKTAALGHLVAGSRGDKEVLPDVVNPPTAEQPDALPQARHVDVTDKNPPKYETAKKVGHYALPSTGRYPLDSYAQVKAASSYFVDYAPMMPVEERREFAHNLFKRAAALSVAVAPIVEKYGSSTFAPEDEIKVAFDARRLELDHGNTGALLLLNGIEHQTRQKMWKEASAEPAPDPEVVALALWEFDKVAGLDHLYDRTIPDPFFSVLGGQKTAQPEFSEVIGNDVVTEEDLRRLARIGAWSVKHSFNEDFLKEFQKDPVGIFKALPLDQKRMMMRMANDTSPGLERTY
jgi:hypothetical protein